MAIVYTVAEPTVAPLVPLQSHGNHRVRVVTLTSDGGTYVAGGDLVTAAAVGLTRVEYGDANVLTPSSTAGTDIVEVAIVPQAAGGFLVKLNEAAAELTAAAVTASLVIQARLYGKN